MAPVTRDVLALVAKGLSNRAITARLTITERTVEAHVAQIFAKLGLHDSPDSDLRQAGAARLSRLAPPRPGGAHAHPAGTAGRGLKLDGAGRAV
jgi:hypothetical protein